MYRLLGNALTSIGMYPGIPIETGTPAELVSQAVLVSRASHSSHP